MVLTLPALRVEALQWRILLLDTSQAERLEFQGCRGVDRDHECAMGGLAYEWRSLLYLIPIRPDTTWLPRGVSPSLYLIRRERTSTLVYHTGT